LIAAFLVETNRPAHQGCDLIDLLLAARVISDLALLILAIGAVDEDGDRDSVDFLASSAISP